MTKHLRTIISEICKYGREQAPGITNKRRHLEQHLVQLYACNFNPEPDYDPAGYPEYKAEPDPELRKHIGTHFPEFGYYATVLHPLHLDMDAPPAVGDAVDDLADIIAGLTEVNWRMAHTSEADAWWHFQLLFRIHLRDHLLGLLCYLRDLDDRDSGSQ